MPLVRDISPRGTEGAIRHFWSGEIRGEMADPEPAPSPDPDPSWTIHALTRLGRGCQVVSKARTHQPDNDQEAGCKMKG
jgi:hypothetical protein